MRMPAAFDQRLHRIEVGEQRCTTAVLDGDGFHHRHAELAGENVGVDLDALGAARHRSC